MQPNNEEIIRILADAASHLRGTLAALASHGATPNTLSCITEAMRSLNQAFFDQELNQVPMRSSEPSLCIDPIVRAKFDSIEKAIAHLEQGINQNKEVNILEK
jgi:hypothetical protein